MLVPGPAEGSGMSQGGMALPQVSSVLGKMMAGHLLKRVLIPSGPSLLALCQQEAELSVVA